MQLSHLLVFFICGGLLFMLLPGTFLGVWNLVSISGRRAAESISPAWIQAYGHAQVLGWIGSFILEIGFYSIPKLRGGRKPFALWSAWLTGTMWMAGVLLRWLANVYLWQWRMSDWVYRCRVVVMCACREEISWSAWYFAIALLRHN